MNTEVETNSTARPGWFGRLRSRQAGLPAGLLGRLVGRLMVKDTAASNDAALTLLQLAEQSTVLEVGFGQGRTVELLVSDGHTVLGVDVSATMVRQARARNRSACRASLARLELGDGRSIPFSDQSVDAALTVHTIYFMPDPAHTIAEIGRVLRPGGRVVIACRVLDDGMAAWKDPNVYRLQYAADVAHMLRDAGFVNIEQHPVHDDPHHVQLFVANRATSG